MLNLQRVASSASNQAPSAVLVRLVWARIGVVWCMPTAFHPFTWSVNEQIFLRCLLGLL